MAVGRLFVVATPIGNLDDISARAIRILGEVQLVAAEDTRRSKQLLRHFGIDTPLTSYHDHNEASKAESLMQELLNGKDVALVSDAGTPCISDPGYRIVRAAHAHGVEVISVPGPSAPVAALAASGLPTDQYAFHGYFPRKQGQAKALAHQIAGIGGTHVFLESPQRLGATLEFLAEAMPEAEVCVARELTKMFEEVRVGKVDAVRDHFAHKAVKGECVLVVSLPSAADVPPDLSIERLQVLVEKVMTREGLSRRDAIRQVATELNVPRNVVYAAAMDHS